MTIRITMEYLETDQLRAWTVAAIEHGRVTWPRFAVSHDEMARVVMARMASAAAERAADSLRSLDGAELYIAIACARGDHVALAAFRTRYFEPLVSSLRRMGLGDAQFDDVWQTVCDRLLVPRSDDMPRILRYAGDGKLGGLVRVAATRMALNWVQREAWRTTGDGWIDRMPAGHADPELHAIKLQHRAELKEELEAAIASLGARERMMLRLHLVERMGIDAIGALCSIHRATAARAIARAKETLAARVRARLVARWKVSKTDLPALQGLVDSQVDLSLARMLAADRGSP